MQLFTFASLGLDFVDMALVVLGIHELGEYLSRMSIGIKVVCVHNGLEFVSLSSSKNIFVVIIVEMLILVEMRL